MADQTKENALPLNISTKLAFDRTRLALGQTPANFPAWEFHVKRLTWENDEN